ncbi:phospholipase D family protein [Janthinobacterium agaricidamnosum]|uniref:Phospholipase D Active site motif family protein n=1 Tax=Janthinobacterium agaricidamnosum NBRC 102515 = DSM 9628 TaxID=1349767 RepID=W0V497_9BURK|nr:phospholipase D family protein [Janthinobacterium agaricidamnosum]CDG82178.1 phospholipase D Active site motif family protein [Janthinobacterium agaricidamnosum NBRC 102515 = DSM 9628]
MLYRKFLPVLLALLLGACASLPPLDGRNPSSVIGGTADTPLGLAIEPMSAAHAGLSGIYPLADGRDAFAARALLADAAQRSLDVQYYIWHRDLTGTLLFDALRKAAERGVRVRLLLDDNNTSGLDQLLALLDSQPNIEVRLFNPFIPRAPRALAFIGDFSRLNRRMHNKSFTADNQAAIVGGRNVGDEYFGAAGDMMFSDLDVLAVGAAVDTISRDFDRYWNSQSAYPVASLLAKNAPQDSAMLKQEAARVAGSPQAREYMKALRESPMVASMMQRSLPFVWAPARLVSDDPAKVLGQAAPDSKVAQKLQQLLGQPETELDLVSPYFVPGKEAEAAFEAMSRRGIQVRILTNALEATDVAAVHAGYAKWRKPLLRAGVTLYESRRQWEKSNARERSGPFGSSASSLHAKTFAVDGKRIFVGSFNFDPRSIELNTEMGLVIDSPVLARQLATAMRHSVPLRAYQVRLNDDGSLYWIARNGDSEVRYDTEPGASYWKRLGVGILSLLPIDWLL